MTHERLDYQRHFKIPLGSAAEACNQGFPCNQLPERAITGIYVGPAKNFQEGHELYGAESYPKVSSAAGDKLFEVDENSDKLSSNEHSAGTHVCQDLDADLSRVYARDPTERCDADSIESA